MGTVIPFSAFSRAKCGVLNCGFLDNLRFNQPAT
jgi:hypothetical protein